MQVIKLASSTEFTTKIRKVSNFCTEVIHFKLEALGCVAKVTHFQDTKKSIVTRKVMSKR